MLTSFKPPTDNLYKFMAITGLILVVLGVVLTVQRFGVLMESHTVAADLLQQAWLDADENQAVYDLLNKYWLQAKDGSTAFGLTLEAQEIDGVSPEAIASLRRFEIAAEEMARGYSLNHVTNQLLGALLGIGLFFMVTGFFAWYFRTQKYQDAIIRQQAKEAGVDVSPRSDAKSRRFDLPPI